MTQDILQFQSQTESTIGTTWKDNIDDDNHNNTVRDPLSKQLETKGIPDFGLFSTLGPLGGGG
jgi:hypothetical protein